MYGPGGTVAEHEAKARAEACATCGSRLHTNEEIHGSPGVDAEAARPLPVAAAPPGDFSLPVAGPRAQHTYRPPSLILIACLVAGPFLSSCGTAPARRVLTSVNGYEYHVARYAETCPTKAPGCPEKAAALRTWSKALDEANAALKRGGDLPLQLRALATAEKAVPK